MENAPGPVIASPSASIASPSGTAGCRLPIPRPHDRRYPLGSHLSGQKKSISACPSPASPSASNKCMTIALVTFMDYDLGTSISRLGRSNCWSIHLAQKCYLCSRYKVLPMFPGRTLEKMEPRVGVEPTTCRLRIGCSTTELPRPFFMTIASAENYCQFIGEYGVRNVFSTKTETSPSQSRCPPKETKTATTGYI